MGEKQLTVPYCPPSPAVLPSAHAGVFWLGYGMDSVLPAAFGCSHRLSHGGLPLSASAVTCTQLHNEGAELFEEQPTELCARSAATSHSTNCSTPTPAPRASLFYLVFLRALQELLQLGVQLGESPRYPLYPCVQVSVLVVFCIEVVLVTLTLLRRGNGCVFSRGRIILFITLHVFHPQSEHRGAKAG